MKQSSPPTGAVAADLRKRWLYLLPAVFVTYSLAYLDRANYGFGAARAWPRRCTSPTRRPRCSDRSSFSATSSFRCPASSIARRRNASRLIFYALIVWGVLAALTGVIRSFWLLALDRLLLGVAESLIFPAMLLLLTNWFTRSERSRANTLLILGNPVTILWMSAITGFLIRSFGWQMTFVIEGLPSIAWAAIWMLIVRDKPEQASWMSAEASAISAVSLPRSRSRCPRSPACSRP